MSGHPDGGSGERDPWIPSDAYGDAAAAATDRGRSGSAGARGAPVDGQVVAGAAAAGGAVGLVAGLLVGLPVMAATAGAAAASYAAAVRRDETGDKARELGEQASGLFTRARALSRQYRVSEKLEEAAQVASTAAVGAVAAAQKFDQEHQVSARAAAAANQAAVKAGQAVEAAKAYDEQHKVLERAAAAAAVVAETGQKVGERAAVAARRVDERLHIADKANALIDQIAPLPASDGSHAGAQGGSAPAGHHPPRTGSAQDESETPPGV